MQDLSLFSSEDLISILTTSAAEELKRRGYNYGWYRKDLFIGSVYILVNPAFKDLVKIGYADDVEKRLKILNSSSGLPDPFHCYAIYRIKKQLGDLRLHKLIDTLNPALRHAKNREFYEMTCQKAFEILSAIAQINGDEEQLIINPFKDTYFNNTTTTPHSQESQKLDRLKPLRFDLLGIPVGSTLVFTKNTGITCTTTNEKNKVRYEGKTYAISRLAAKLLNNKAAQGGLYFTYNGETLTDIRRRLGV